MLACWFNQSWGLIYSCASSLLLLQVGTFSSDIIWVRGLRPALTAPVPRPVMDSAEVLWLWSTATQPLWGARNPLGGVALAVFFDTRRNATSRCSQGRLIANVNENSPELRIYQCHICDGWEFFFFEANKAARVQFGYRRSIVLLACVRSVVVVYFHTQFCSIHLCSPICFSITWNRWTRPWLQPASQ